MSTQTETSDAQLIELLRRRGPMTVAELAEVQAVTATAVRQRLTRLMAQGMIERRPSRVARGRPSHRYRLTDQARRLSGSNFADLAIMLWNELRSLKDPAVRSGLLKRLALAMARNYAAQISGTTLEDRMKSLQTIFAERRVPLEMQPVAGSSSTALTVVDCPYPELAERDRGICAMEKMLFAELLQNPLKLSQCRLDGHACCQFEADERRDIVIDLSFDDTSPAEMVPTTSAPGAIVPLAVTQLAVTQLTVPPISVESGRS